MVKSAIRFWIVCIVGLFAFGASALAGSVDAADSARVQGDSAFYQFVIAGGPIVWFVLLPMSILTVSLVIEMFITIRHSRLVPSDSASAIIDLCRKFPAVQIPIRLKDRKDLLSMAAARTIKKILNSKEAIDVQTAGADSLYEQAQPLIRRTEWCNMIGNVAPMVGLLGTVYGMIKAFNVLGVSAGQPEAHKLASAIAMALITTFWGLAIAIPALVVCGIFRNRIEVIITEAAVELENVLGRINFKAVRKIKTKQPTKNSIEIISPEGVEIK